MRKGENRGGDFCSLSLFEVPRLGIYSKRVTIQLTASQTSSHFWSQRLSLSLSLNETPLSFEKHSHTQTSPINIKNTEPSSKRRTYLGLSVGNLGLLLLFHLLHEIGGHSVPGGVVDASRDALFGCCCARCWCRRHGRDLHANIETR